MKGPLMPLPPRDESVHALLEVILELVPNGNFRDDLIRFRDGIFLELPERRGEYLRELQGILSEHLPCYDHVEHYSEWQRRLIVTWQNAVGRA
jgi:hypothetical protein